MARIRLLALTGNEVTEDELAEHGLSFDDVLAVFDGPAKYFPQQERPRRDRIGMQPERLVMIGPDDTGRLLTVVLELPNRYGKSHVVTGFPSNRGQKSRYNQPGGRTRTQ